MLCNILKIFVECKKHYTFANSYPEYNLFTLKTND